MDLNKIRDLDIAKTPFKYSKDILESIDYLKWVEFIEKNRNYFIWEEETTKGLEILKNINKVPEWAREGRLSGLNKKNAFAEFNEAKGFYLLQISYSQENKRIRISFEMQPSLEQIKLFYKMAKHLDALLLKDGTEIIDDQLINKLSK